MPISTNDQEIYDLAVSMRRGGHREVLQKRREKGQYSETSPGHRLVLDVSKKIYEGIEDFIINYKTRVTKGKISLSEELKDLLIRCKPHVCAAVVTDVVINRVAIGEASNSSVTALTKETGKMIRELDWIRQHREANPGGWSKISKQLEKNAKSRSSKARGGMTLDEALERVRVHEECDPEYEFNELSREEEAMVARYLVNLMTHLCPTIFQLVVEDVPKHGGRGFRRKSYYRFTDEVVRKISDMEELFSQVTPLNLPITDVPQDWTTPFDGGFWDNAMYRRTLMSTTERKAINEFAMSDCPEIYKAINTLQRVQWEINPEVLEVYREAAATGWNMGNIAMPMEEEEYPKPEHPGRVEKDSIEWKAYTRAMSLRASTLNSWALERTRVNRHLFLADYYADKKFYYVHQIDFRGRIYPTASGLNYQGADYSRGSVRFAKGKPIENKEQAAWFFIHGANCWGYDKATFEDRVSWVNAHKDAIQRVYEDPLEERFWTNADKPWLFLAWCLEAGQFFEEGYGFESKLPISMDGSNNGLQIYSLLLRDLRGGRATNCVPQETPADIYQDVADAVNARLEEIQSGADASATALERDYARGFLFLSGGGMPRKAMKRSVMTYVYGATQYARQSYIADWYFDEVRGKNFDPPPFPPKTAYKACVWMSKLVNKELETLVSAARDAMRWMQTCSRVVTSHGKICRWVSPTGLNVLQRYTKSNRRSINLSVGRKIWVSLYDDTGEVDSKRSSNGLCPNFVHSLDAAAATMTVNRGAEAGITHFMMIHDSFSCHAADAPALAKVLRDVYYDIFTQPLLENLRRDLQSLVPDTELPPVPTPGELDLEDLKEATYFFA